MMDTLDSVSCPSFLCVAHRRNKSTGSRDKTRIAENGKRTSVLLYLWTALSVDVGKFLKCCVDSVLPLGTSSLYVDLMNEFVRLDDAI